MEENINNTSDKPKSEEPSSVNLIITFKDFIGSLYSFVRETLSFTEEVDKEATIKVIKAEIDFKGFNIWILIFSIIIAISVTPASFIDSTQYSDIGLFAIGRSCLGPV